MHKQEIEVKFIIKDMKPIVSSLIQLGAMLRNPRIHEMNLRFDTSGHDFTKELRVLRLRKDTHARLTYKSAAVIKQDVSMREEIEFEVNDFAAARSFLEALGFEVCVIYEKYRTTYELDELEIVLDEMPFGQFVEIEGSDPTSIRKMADAMGLNWSKRCTLSYLALLDHYRSAHNNVEEHLTFANFDNIQVNAEDLGLMYADQ